MFYYQQSINSGCISCSEELFYKVIRTPRIKSICNEVKSLHEKMMMYKPQSEEWTKWHDAKNAEKRKLPCFIFMAGDIAKEKSGDVEIARRKASNITLNGLVMADFDNMDDPTTLWDEMQQSPDKFEDVLLAHVTPSGHGLRFVFKADVKMGDIAANQQAFARRIGLPLDEACKDSSRVSYAISKNNILMMKPEIFDYENKAFDDAYGDMYRNGQSTGQGVKTVAAKPSPLPSHPQTDYPRNEKGELLFKKVPYREIIEELEQSLGGKPVVGERNNFYYDTVRLHVRYLCDHNADLILQVMPDYGLSEQERRATIAQALAANRWRMSDPLLSILREKGLLRQDGMGSGLKKHTDFDHQRWFKTFKPFFDGPWRAVTDSLDDDVKLAGFLAAGAMFGTYLSPVRIKGFYDGKDWRLSFMVYIIGQAASGKGIFVELNNLIMEPMMLLDEQGRKWEERYKEDKEKRSTSTKNQKDAAMEIQHFPIRVLPGTISNAMRYKRMKDAVTIINGEERHLHCYIYESELAAKLRSEQGTWAGAQDLDCKSFSNEYGGNDYGNTQAVNGLMEINLNQVITGTHEAMNRKITPRNCLDGLATRLIMYEMPDNSFVMLKKNQQHRKETDKIFLRTIGTLLSKCVADVDITQQVAVPKKWQHIFGPKTSLSDALYQWGCDEADRCREADDHCADYFRRRAPIIAARYAVVDAILRQVDTFAETGKLRFKFKNILLAYHLASYFQEAQMYFFGQKVMDAIKVANKNFVPEVKRVSKGILRFNSLPETFTIDDMNLPINASRCHLKRWRKSGYIKDISTNRYRKLVNEI